jgi:hypothetical protein
VIVPVEDEQRAMEDLVRDVEDKEKEITEWEEYQKEIREIRKKCVWIKLSEGSLSISCSHKGTHIDELLGGFCCYCGKERLIVPVNDLEKCSCGNYARLTYDTCSTCGAKTK